MRLVSYKETKDNPCTPWDFERDGMLDRQVMEDMVGLLLKTKLPNGLVPVAMAAPQVGIFKRFFVIAPPGQVVRWVVNPTLTVLSAKRTQEIEGCLSVPGDKFVVERARSVSLSGFDHYGKPFTWGACKGLLGRIVQHETDHLVGRCILDHGTPVTEHRAAGV